MFTLTMEKYLKLFSPVKAATSLFQIDHTCFKAVVANLWVWDQWEMRESNVYLIRR